MKLVYEGNWHTYEEWGGVRIFEDEHGEFWQQDGGYSVMDCGNDPDWDDPYKVSYVTALNVIDEWDTIEKENREYWEDHGW